jgi:hypothetical protein
VKIILPASLDFLSGARFWLFQIGLFSIAEEMSVSIEMKSSVLEAGSSSILFRVRIELVFEKKTFSYLGYSR